MHDILRCIAYASARCELLIQVSYVICLCFCLVTRLNCAKTAEPIVMKSGVRLVRAQESTYYIGYIQA